MNLQRRLAAEGLGTAVPLAAVVGSGIMGERLAGGNVAIALLANAIATGSTLVALISDVRADIRRALRSRCDDCRCVTGRAWVARCSGGHCPCSVPGPSRAWFAAHVMFGEQLFQLSNHTRTGSAQLFSEFVATFGLLAVIWGCSRRRADSVPFAVGLYITGAYWFTASTSFANPAVTAARSLTNTFTGIRPADAPGFIAAQLCGAAVATVLFRWLVPTVPQRRTITTTMRKRVLILCTGNSARSQMAEGLLRAFGGANVEVFSAGTRPGIVRPEAIAVMSELGIDLSGHRSKHVREFDGQHFDYVITVCDNANETCPIFPGTTRRIHWSFPDSGRR